MTTNRKGWTHKQKRLHIMACRDAGIGDEHRRLLLRQLGAAAIVDGEATSTSPRLTDADFDKFMSCVESCAPGGRVLDFQAGHWAGRFAQGGYSRAMHQALRMQRSLADAGVQAEGAIAKAIGREFETMHHLDYHELVKALNAMRTIAKRGSKNKGGTP